ncbi:hypothetical protein BJ138DRAFT_1104165 [Hygrophoropsis aurantiaca]|uniref:Uncharacterized protein n=1 Tax=Hygrophoropsis aurantiaca TaxID=72124 RepID=A0ACB8A393_9AGAM|nr:hypothetical protein BJ138DRAFT_1104165 [Hygrophoropsis aurantiaca]
MLHFSVVMYMNVLDNVNEERFVSLLLCTMLMPLLFLKPKGLRFRSHVAPAVACSLRATKNSWSITAKQKVFPSTAEQFAIHRKQLMSSKLVKATKILQRRGLRMRPTVTPGTVMWWDLQNIAIQHILRKCDLTQDDLDILEKPLELLNDPTGRGKDYVHKANSSRKKVAALYRTLYNEQAHTVPTPSSYARRSKWAVWQKKNTAILCLRPPEKQGLPLCLLDNVFRTFRINASAALPITFKENVTIEVAHALCAEMGGVFEDERARSECFFKFLQGVFGRQ